MSTDIHNKDVSLSATEFNTLRILFNIEGKTTGKQLSGYAPFFQTPQSTQTNKVHMNVISDWINSLLLPVESAAGVLKLNNLNKGVTVKRQDDMQYNFGGTHAKLCIIGCEDSFIYVDSCVETLLVSSCINCTVFVAAVSKVCTIEKCENATLCVATKLLRIGNCVDTLVHSYTAGSNPIVYGDTRNLRMAPHNAHYKGMLTHMQAGGIKFDQEG